MPNTVQLMQNGQPVFPLTDASIVTGLQEMIFTEVVTSIPAGGFLPNVVYDLGILAGAVTFTLAAAADNTIVNPYHWTFESGTTVPTVTWPTGLIWAGGSAPTINASKHYEIMVRNGYATFLEF